MPQIIVFNVGSSSVKFRIYDAHNLEEISSEKIKCDAENTHQQAIQSILRKHGINFSAAIHRVVHGGPHYGGAMCIDDEVLAELEKFAPFAPLHQVHNIAAIRSLQNLCPTLKQYACFDTSFHQGHDAVFDTYALPAHIRNLGLRRYGFHGLSYQWVAQSLENEYPVFYKGRVIAAHLGNGASVCAMLGGKSIDSSMGLTALEGLPMGTRSGSIDPGLVLYLAKDLKMPTDEIENMLYNQSGLLGLSGLSNDVEILLKSESPQAKFALDVFCLKTAQAIAQMAVSIGGMEALVFTGGIGENAVALRHKVIEYLSFMPKFETIIIHTNEEKVMMQDVKALLQ